MSEGLGRYVLRRLAFLPVGVLIVVTATFVLINLTPGDPARIIGGGMADEQRLEEIRADLGLDRPLGERYVSYVTDLARGDLGTSYFTGRPITAELRQRVGDSFELVVLGLVVAGAIGLTLGGIGAYFPGGWRDRGTRLITSVAQSVPDFVWGLVLIFVLFYILGWVPPPVGRLGFADTAPPPLTGALILDALLARQWDTAWSALRHAIMPVLALGIFYSAFFAKTSRAALGTAFRSDQVDFARACGLPTRKVLLYGLRQGLAPILTYAAILFAVLLGGAAIVETLFAWGGIGQWAIVAVLDMDVPAIQGFILITGTVTLMVYLLLDVIVAVLDPRVTYE